ncbi:ubiquinone biosynthesis protein UbiJ [Pseudomonas duriflava]|uniref:Ubiquinone biosynthesis accessory factor UbiJ n=1 Tax=Pseudomonas duriflava TaxID=459528 RepID=A0A562QDC6_9PSED|nr:SCP2 sterol-binding domain-containing protein [Pseudomonas duriflava]TWI54160.1 ubiquinone biosynthesis protein UbiJ [Pseudomonas duriflava]
MIVLTQAVLAAFERGLNSVLAMDAVALTRLAALQGTVIAIDCPAPAFRLFLLPAGDGLHIAAHHEADVDCTIRAPMTRLTQLALAQNKTAILHSDDVILEGDSTALIELSDILQGLELDWEYELSRWLGPVGAALIGRFARNTGDWTKQSQASLQRSLSDWLAEESRTLVGRREGEARFAEIDALRLAVDRLEARLERLAQRRRT